MENDASERQLSLDWIEGEVEAGFVFVAAAEECRASDRGRFQACVSDARDCYAAGAPFLSHPGLTTEQRQVLGINLYELRRRLDLLQEKELPPSAAA